MESGLVCASNVPRTPPLLGLSRIRPLQRARSMAAQILHFAEPHREAHGRRDGGVAPQEGPHMGAAAVSRDVHTRLQRP